MGNNQLLEKELNELYKKVKKGERLGRSRRIFAYVLKIIASGSGLAVATGVFTSADQRLGVAILIALFIDAVFSNHMRLLAETRASHAYKALSKKVKLQYNSKRNAVACQAQSGNTAAKAELEKMMQQALTDLSTGIDNIDTTLNEEDIKALQTLALDYEKN